ncbi:UNVERIFIED_CONTAM: cysteine desulfurase [Acetivibrio alkalicellulosi]
MNREIYLDNSATTKPYQRVVDAVNDININVYGNPSSLHKKGIEAEKHIKRSKEIIAMTLGAKRDEVYFTSGGTEANNLAILGYLAGNPRKGKHIITSKIEHPSVIEVFNYLSSQGYKIDFLDVDRYGVLNINGLKDKICKDTSLISIIYVNNETGTIEPIDEVAKIKNSIGKDVVIHVDAVQAYGKMNINPKKYGIDIMTISSHKIHGPKGVGALYINKDVRIKPILFGGGQESSIRSGTENVSGIYGFGVAAQIAFESMEKNTKACYGLRELLLNKLLSDIGEVEIISPTNSSPYILNVSFKNIKSEVLLHHLEEKNIFVSTGAACSSKKNVHSHVLKALGLSPDIIEGAIRFSFSSNNTVEDIEETINALKDIIPKIKIKGGGKR